MALMGVVIAPVSFAVFFPDPAVLLVIVAVVLSLPTAVAFALPPAIYCDVVDYDEQRSGVRREGIYAGALAFVNKSLLACASAMIVYVLALGDTAEHPVGILLLYTFAAGIVFIGTAIFATYPLRS